MGHELFHSASQSLNVIDNQFIEVRKFMVSVVNNKALPHRLLSDIRVGF
jgi:hypothetical protein